ncbi:putative methionyl-tRNA synthetase [Hordeum vulgare]|nr:putative methionyl-tRNA synthetase [Hordeum vulgare]
MGLRRGPLPFVPGSAPQSNNADAEMEEIINNGSAVAASCPGFGTQKETLDIDDDMDEEEVKQEVVKEEVEKEEPAELEPARSKGRKKKKRVANGKPTEPRVKWTAKEDECLAEAWKTVSIDPITGANQNTDTYWRRIKTTFDERKLVDSEFAGIHMQRGDKAMSNHRASIQLACHKWHGIQEEVMARPESGANIERQVCPWLAGP